MNPLVFVLCALALSALGGLVGSLVGLGGGIVVVPGLTLLLGVDIKVAIAASMIAVIATSSGSAVAYTRDRMSNLRVAMFLEVSTVCGGICGALLVGIANPSLLNGFFAAVLLIAAATMMRRRHDASAGPPSALADRLELHGSYPDARTGREHPYRVSRPAVGFAIMYFAGVASGMLGIGGGVFKVPAMDLAMRLPIKVSTATSNLMIGVTGTAAALIYLLRGDVNPVVAAPVAIGVLGGANLGARLMPRVNDGVLRRLFVVVMVLTAVQMAAKI